MPKVLLNVWIVALATISVAACDKPENDSSLNSALSSSPMTEWQDSGVTVKNASFVLDKGLVITVAGYAGYAYNNGSADAIKVWNLGDQSLQHSFSHKYSHPVYEDGCTDSIEAYDVSSDGKFVAAGFRSTGIAKIWHLGTGELKHTLRAASGDFSYLKFSNGGDRLIAATSRGLRIWDLKTGSIKYDMDGYWPRGGLSPDESTVLLGEDSGRVKAWNFETGEPKYQYSHGRGIKRLLVSPDSSLLVTAAEPLNTENLIGSEYFEMMKHRVLQVRNLQTGELLKDFDVLYRGWEFAFSADSKFLFAVDKDPNQVKVINLATGEAVGKLIGHDGFISELRVSPDGKKIATASYEDKTVRTWDAQTLAQRLILGHTSSIRDINFSGDGSSLITASFDGKIRIYQMD